MEQPPTEEQVEQWLARARAGDSEALGQLLLYCGGEVRRWPRKRRTWRIGSRLRPKLDFTDVVQQSYLEAQHDFPRFQGNTASEIAGWFLQIFGHTLDDMRRRYRTRKRSYRREAGPGEEAAAENALAAGPMPLEEIVKGEEKHRGNIAMLMLPLNYYLVLYFRIGAGMSFEEIADLQKRTEESARKLYRRAFDKLCETLARPNAISEFGRQLEMQRKRRCPINKIYQFAERYAQQMKV